MPTGRGCGSVWHRTSSGLGASRAWVVLKMPTIYLVSSLAWRVYSANDRIQWAGILAIVPRKDTVPTLGLQSLSQLSGSDRQAPHSQSGVERFLFPGRVPQNPKANLIPWDSYKKKKKKNPHIYLECSYLDKKLRARDLGPAGVH